MKTPKMTTKKFNVDNLPGLQQLHLERLQLRLRVFPGLGALGEVSAGDDHVGTQERPDLLQRVADGGEVGRPEVEIGDVEDREHVGYSLRARR